MIFLFSKCFSTGADSKCQHEYSNQTLPKGLREKLDRDLCERSGRAKRSYGSEKPADYSKVTLRGFPKDGPHRGYASLIVYNVSTRAFDEYVSSPGVYGRMRDQGVFKGKLNDFVLLVHGWHSLQSSWHIFQPLLRMHTVLTPNTTVIYVKWEGQGANDVTLGNAAWAATRLNIGEFLKDVNENTTKLHCVGHSLGGHACATVCRHFRELKGRREQCKRIVALDPASVSFKHDSPDPDVKNYRVSRYDADYVAALLTNRNFAGLADVVGDEYITTNIMGWNSEACPTLGKWTGTICATGYTGVKHCEYVDLQTMGNSAIIPHTSDSCSHMMAPVMFMKFLDINSSVPVVHLRANEPKNVDNPLLSVWSSYTTSRDYRLDSYYGSYTVWYSFHVDPYTLRPADQLLLYVKGNDEVKVHNAKTSSKYSYGMFTVWVFVIQNQWGSKQPIFLKSSQAPTVARLTKGQGFSLRPEQLRYPVTPMTTQVERQMKCQRVTGQYEYNYKCVYAGQGEKRLMAYRSQMRVVEKSTQVPPVGDDCLPYTGWFGDSIKTTLLTVEAKVDEETKVWWDRSHSMQFMDARIQSSTWGGRELVLCSFWDGCGDKWPEYKFEYNFDRLKGQIRLRFSNASTYTIKLQFRYTLQTVSVRVSEGGPEWKRGVRILPYVYKAWVPKPRTTTTTSTPTTPSPTTSSTTPSTSATTMTTSFVTMSSHHATLSTSSLNVTSTTATSGYGTTGVNGETSYSVSTPSHSTESKRTSTGKPKKEEEETQPTVSTFELSSWTSQRVRGESTTTLTSESFGVDLKQHSLAKLRSDELDSKPKSNVVPAIVLIVVALGMAVFAMVAFMKYRSARRKLSMLHELDCVEPLV